MKDELGIGVISFIYSVFAGIISGIILNVISSFFTGYFNFKSIITSIIFVFSNYWWLILILTLILYVIKYLRFEMGKGNEIMDIDLSYLQEGDYYVAGYFKYNNLFWEITCTKYADELKYYVNWPVCMIELEDGKPCLTKLTQEKDYLWYTWHCSNCGFKYRTLEYKKLSSENVRKNLDGFIKRERISNNKELNKALWEKIKEN